MDLYNVVDPNIERVLRGYNFTIFAYGQTGSGKTHTMFGKDGENIFNKRRGRQRFQNTYIQNINKDQDLVGIIPRAIHKLFLHTTQTQFQKQKFNIYCSFLQIYNERIYDLLTVRNYRP